MTKIEITNKFTDSVKIIEVANSQAWKALNHYRAAWNTSSVRFV